MITSYRSKSNSLRPESGSDPNAVAPVFPTPNKLDHRIWITVTVITVSIVIFRAGGLHGRDRLRNRLILSVLFLMEQIIGTRPFQTM